ncbi:MAG TPA: hypothetical protein VH985_11460 [Candidatus Binatia bacterium]
MQTLAQNSQPSTIPAADASCDGLARACSAAAKELRAARELIKGYEANIAAADARIELAQKEIESLKQLGDLERARAAELESVITAEREAKDVLIKLKEEQAQRIAGLEKKLSRSRKFALIAGVAAVVAILVGVRR